MNDADPKTAASMRRQLYANRVRVPSACVIRRWLVISCLAIGFGCDASHNKSTQREDSHLKALAILYGKFAAEHRGRRPANETEFKRFIAKKKLDEFIGVKVADAEALFISNRDHQPYAVIYGAVKGTGGPGGSPVVAYERIGAGGKRFAASALGAVEEVDEQALHEWVADEL